MKIFKKILKKIDDHNNYIKIFKGIGGNNYIKIFKKIDDNNYMENIQRDRWD